MNNFEQYLKDNPMPTRPHIRRHWKDRIHWNEEEVQDND